MPLIHDLPTVITAIATAGQTVFSFPFQAYAATDLEVTVNGVAAVYASAPVGSLQFSAALNVDEGGTITFGAGLVLGSEVVINSAIPLERVTQFPSSGPVPMSDVNLEFNRHIRMMQDIRTTIGEAMRVPSGETGFTLPSASERASKFLFFDASGNPVASAGTGVDDGLRAELGASNGVALVNGAVNGSAAVTSKFITNLDGASIPRVGDRLFVGGANANDGNWPNIVKDWYSTYEAAQGRSSGIIVSSQMAVLTNNYAGAAVAGIFAARTSNLGPTVGGAVGLEAHVVNDNVVTPHDGWAGYSEATRDAEGVGSIITWEMDARNKGVYHAIGPVNQHAKQSVVLQIASGAALGSGGVDDISAGINFRHNPTKMGAGIVFGYNSIRGTDGSSGTGNAMLLGPRQRITWTDLSDVEMSSIQSTLTNAAMKTRLAFSDLGTLILGPNDNINFMVPPVGSAANYFKATAGAAGIAPVFEATGSDANIDLKLISKGTGTIAFGNSANFVANGAGTPVFTNTLPAGLSVTVKKWLAIHDHAGAFFVIPLFGV